MTESFVQVTPDSTGKKVRTEEITVGANLVEQEVTTLAKSDGTLLDGVLAGMAQEGTDNTGVSQLDTGSGIRGWLSGCYKALTGTLAVSAAALPMSAGAASALITNISVGTAAVALPATALTSRKAVRIWNASGNAIVYLGYSGGVLSGAPAAGGAQGVPLAGGQVWSADLGPGITVYGIVATGTAIVQVEEIA